MVQDGTGRDEGSAKSVQEGTERDEKGPDGTKTTGLQNRGLEVDAQSTHRSTRVCFATSPPGPVWMRRNCAALSSE